MSEQTRTTIYLKEQDRERLQRLSRYGLGTSAAVRAGLALLEEKLKGDDRMDWRMTTENRTAQVDYLRDLAADLAFGSDDPSAPAADRVNHYCTEFASELPSWFDDHDRALLIEMLTD